MGDWLKQFITLLHVCGDVNSRVTHETPKKLSPTYNDDSTVIFISIIGNKKELIACSYLCLQGTH